MKFYHFSDQEINGEYLDPRHFGKHAYSKFSLYIDSTSRLYFYNTRHAQESCTKIYRYRYTINISKRKLANCDIYLPSEAKTKGYLGIHSTKTSPWQGCVIFQPIKILKKTDLWEIKTK